MLILVMLGPIAEKLHGKVQNVGFFNLTFSGKVKDIPKFKCIGVLLSVVAYSDISINFLNQWGL